MSVSDIEHQKRQKMGRRGAEGRQNAINDATPDIQSPGMIKEIGKEKAGKQKAEKGASSRSNRSHQH
jgi:hypothetical protein